MTAIKPKTQRIKPWSGVAAAGVALQAAKPNPVESLRCE